MRIWLRPNKCISAMANPVLGFFRIDKQGSEMSDRVVVPSRFGGTACRLSDDSHSIPFGIPYHNTMPYPTSQVRSLSSGQFAALQVLRYIAVNLRSPST